VFNKLAGSIAMFVQPSKFAGKKSTNKFMHEQVGKKGTELSAARLIGKNGRTVAGGRRATASSSAPAGRRRAAPHVASPKLTKFPRRSYLTGVAAGPRQRPVRGGPHGYLPRPHPAARRFPEGASPPRATTHLSEDRKGDVARIPAVRRASDERRPS